MYAQSSQPVSTFCTFCTFLLQLDMAMDLSGTFSHPTTTMRGNSYLLPIKMMLLFKFESEITVLSSYFRKI